ncbi:MAG: hypothetical protein KatS3mg042_0577 [Rhodothermaceae bacterium]|nr:MAG: hypothetical protein KatS3mg042_0577 [Rhodothermaceae bacterium]
METYIQEGHRVYEVPHRKWLSHGTIRHSLHDVLHHFLLARKLGAHIDAIGPDLVYVNTVVSLGGILAARSRGVSCIWHLRELLSFVGGEMKVPRIFYPAVQRIISGFPDAVVAPSRVVANTLVGNARAPRVHIVPNAVADCFFAEQRSRHEARADLGLPQQGRMIGVPGMLRKVKGHAFCFEAVQSLLAADPQMRLVVTGKGTPDYEAQLHALARELHIEQQVLFLGVLQDMPAFYRACDVVCVPSRSEPFGRTVIEAMAVGTPVVASAVDGILESITPDENGLLVPYGDVGLLSSSLARVLGDDELATRLGERGRCVARKRYHESAYQAALQSLVEEVLARRKTI